MPRPNMSPVIKNPGFGKRAGYVSDAIDIGAGLRSILMRMSRKKDCPYWLREELKDLEIKAHRLILPLEEHRDELKAEDVRFCPACNGSGLGGVAILAAITGVPDPPCPECGGDGWRREQR